MTRRRATWALLFALAWCAEFPWLALGRAAAASGAVIAASEQVGHAPALLTRTATAEQVGRLHRTDAGSALVATRQLHREEPPELTHCAPASLPPDVYGCRALPRHGSRAPDEPS